MTTLEEEMRELVKNLQPCPNCKSTNVTVIRTVKTIWNFEHIKYGIDNEETEDVIVCTYSDSDFDSEHEISTVCTECKTEVTE